MTADLKLEIQIDQTPEVCFDLWTQPEEISKWWGPRDDAGLPFNATIHSWSALPGEVWAVTMTAPDGSKCHQSGKMLEIRRPQFIRFSFAWVTEGQRDPETEIRVQFEPRGLGTRLIFEQIGFATEATRDDHIVGWRECLDRLGMLAEDAKEPEA